MRVPRSIFQFPLCLLSSHGFLAKSHPLSLSFIILRFIEEEVMRLTHISLEALALFISISFANLTACRVTDSFQVDWDCPSFNTECPVS